MVCVIPFGSKIEEIKINFAASQKFGDLDAT